MSWSSNAVRIPPTISPFIVGFVTLKERPEMFTDFYNIKSNKCTCHVSRLKSIGILFYFLSLDFTTAFPQHVFYVDVVDCIFWLGTATRDLLF
jgi:hypothetical protein